MIGKSFANCVYFFLFKSKKPCGYNPLKKKKNIIKQKFITFKYPKLQSQKRTKIGQGTPDKEN